MSLRVERLGRRGPPLVLIHGWAFHSGVWDPVARVLAGGFSVYLVDLPGHGASRDPLPGETAAQAARDLLSVVPPSAYWVGWSLGGLVALSAALQASPGLAGVTLVASTPRFIAAPDWPHGVPATVLSGFAQDLARDLPGTLARFVALQTRGSAGGARGARTLSRTLREGPEPRPEGLERGLAWLQDTDLRADLGRLSCPVHVLLGERDTLVPPACLSDVLALRPDWTGSVAAGAGHAPFLSDPPGFARAIAEGARRAQ